MWFVKWSMIQVGARWAFMSRAYYGDVPIINISRRSLLQLEVKRPCDDVVVTPNAGRLLITTSRRRELNQPASVTCGRWEQPTLVSSSWKNRLSYGDDFTINRLQQHAPCPDTDISFQSLGLEPKLVSALNTLGIYCPTWVQKKTIPILLEGKSVICAAETGSGKTLGYLLPLIHKLRSKRQCVSSTDPCSLILVPSRELARQVVSIAQSLCAQLGLIARFMGGGHGLASIERHLRRGPIDILVATPGALWKTVQMNKVSLTELNYVVLDEADTLFDDSFSELVENLLMHTQIVSNTSEVHNPEKRAQLAVIGATIPVNVGQVLSKMMDIKNVFTIKSRKLYFLLPHVQQTFVRLKGADKVSELLNLLKKQAIESPGAGILVFCNTSTTVNWLGYILDDHSIKHNRLHSQMPAKMRVSMFELFKKGHSDILVCTDIASRGLDNSRVKFVVNYDFPATLQDYLHRVGRVGRVGSERDGSVLSFVTHAWDVELVQKIEMAARKRSILPGIDASFKETVQK
ncbi:putative ATP-dependent RNA helicase DDX28 [Rhinophrynus dorsalis]